MKQYSCNSEKKISLLKTLISSSESGFSQTTPSFSELNHFRQLVITKENQHFQLYSTAKKRTSIYRIAFGCIATIFCGLALFTYTLIPQSLLPFLSLNGNGYWIQNSITLFSLGISLFSGCLSATLRAEKDALYSLFQKSRNKLTRIYQFHLAKTGWFSWFPLVPSYQHSLHLKEIYTRSLESIERKREEMLHLFQNIGKGSSFHKAIKENLYNQALLEFCYEMETSIVDFEEQISHTKKINN